MRSPLLPMNCGEARGCPAGTPDEDWFRAVEELRSRAYRGIDRPVC